MCKRLQFGANPTLPTSKKQM